jgi:hypothetical protein
MTIVDIKDLDFAFNGETVLEDMNFTVTGLWFSYRYNLTSGASINEKART